MAISTKTVNIIMGGFDITEYIESPITINERLDEVLDSGSFTFFYKKGGSGSIQTIQKYGLFKKAIEPFTLCEIKTHDTTGTRSQYYYASSDCQRVMSHTREVYMHNVTLYELTKRLETFIVGSKAFSVIWNNSARTKDYNSDYDRIRILVELMNEKYEQTIVWSETNKTRFTNIREYAFGSGSTMFDCLKEIMANENCIPRLTYDGSTYTLTYDDMDAITENKWELSFDEIEGIESTQSVDEYCSEVETEMNDVMGSLHPTTVILTARGEEDVFTKDNACLTLPTNIEMIESIKMIGYGISIANTDGYVTFSVPEMDDSTINTLNVKETVTLLQIAGWINSAFGKSKQQEVVDIMNNKDKYSQNGFTLGVLDETHFAIGYKRHKGTYDEESGKDEAETIKWTTSSSNSFDITNYLLNAEQYNLLEALKQPKYIYYEHGTNQIKGFNQVANDDFWKSLIYGKTSSFMANTMVSTEDGTMAFCNQGADILDKQFKVTYYPMTSIYVKESKSENKASYRTSRSYNNGGSSVDISQLMPEIKKNVNQLGLEMKTITSRTDLPVGAYTEYGYVINKAKTYRLTEDILTENIVYNLSANKQLVAQSVQRATQYEATNLPQTGIITRHIALETSVTDLNKAGIDYSDTENLWYLFLQIDNSNLLVKPAAYLMTNEALTIVCEASDNYAFDYSKEEGATNYYRNNPVPYSDNDNYMKSYKMISLCIGQTESITQKVSNKLPKVEYLAEIGSPRYINLAKSKSIYKDPRERLVFDIRIKDE